MFNKFTRKQNFIILSTSGGFLLWGIVSAIAPLSIYWSFMANQPKYFFTLALIIGPIFLILGNTIFGILADKFGRKNIFIFTLVIYIIGILIISVSFNLVSLLMGLAVSQFGVGGEEPPALALLSENFSHRERIKTLTLIPNFVNIGSAVSALIFLLSFLNTEFSQRIALLTVTVIIFALLIYTRLKIPESYLWLKRRGKIEDSLKIKNELGLEDNGKIVKNMNFKFSFIILVLLGISQYMSFWLMAIAIGPYIYPNLTNFIIFIASVGASVGAFIALPVIKKGKKFFTFISFLGGFLTILIILFFINYKFIFFTFLFINMVFSEFAWVSRTNLEPELFMTIKRTSMIAFVRILPITLYVLALILTINFSAFQFILMNVILWLIGLIGSIIWYIKGIETVNLSLDY